MLLQHQSPWTTPPNNASLQATPTTQQVSNIYQHYSQLNFNHFIAIIQTLSHSNTPLVTIDTTPQLTTLIDSIQQSGWLLLEVIDECHHSFKGYISWILVADDHGSYIIDAALLHDQLLPLNHILQSKQVLKFLLNSSPQLMSFKRDFHIFPMNIFDMNPLLYTNSPQPYAHVDHRPINPTLHSALSHQLTILWKLMDCIPQQLIQNYTYLYHIYQQSNHPDYLLSNYHYQPTTSNTTQEQSLSHEEYSILCALKEWREHTGKLLDVGVESIIPYHLLHEIVSSHAKCILDIQEIAANNHYPLTMDYSTKILEVIRSIDYLQDQFQLPQRPGSKNYKEQKSNVKGLMTQIAWDDPNWLNRKHDQSIQLYKQILSIQQLDQSIVEQYIPAMSEDILQKYQIHRYVKYAQYFRNANYQKLQAYYSAQQQHHQQQHQSWCFQPQHTNQSNQISQHNNSNKQIIHQLTQTHIPSCSNSNSYINKKQLTREAIKPLPQNIQSIYSMAAKIKRNQPVIQKPKKKNQKNNQNKMQQFVPTKEALIKLFNLQVII